MSKAVGYFGNPARGAHRQYEALRARFMDGDSIAKVAARFGYSVGTMHNLCSEFLGGPGEFFTVSRTRAAAPEAAPGASTAGRRNDRILELRGKGWSMYDIAGRLGKEGMATSPKTVAKVLRAAKIGRLPRRTQEERLALVRPERVPKADRNALDWGPRRLETAFGGLFLFADDVARMMPDPMLEGCGLAGTDAVPAGCALRALLGLKLYGIGRPSQVMSVVSDPGLALFAGLNAIPKRSSLTEYTCRVSSEQAAQLMREWLRRAHDRGVPQGESFDLDFHTIPYHGEQALMERHYVSRRSRRQRGVLAFLARDAGASVFCYANATVRKEQAHQEILRFVEFWERQTGARPKELVFDSGLTTHATLAELNHLGITFLTVRRRTHHVLRNVYAADQADWKKVRLNNVGRAYRTPRVLDQNVTLGGYGGEIRQLAIKDLGHEKPVLLLTNGDENVASIVDRYARRMVIENAIADAIDFFHMDALSATVPMKIDLDLQLTLLASILYRRLGQRIGPPYAAAKARTIFRNFVHASAKVDLTPDQVVVRFGRRAHNPYLLAAGVSAEHPPIPWLGDRRLHLQFG